MTLTTNYSRIWIKNKILTQRKESEKTDSFFVVEIVPKDQGVEVLYLLKPAFKFTLWVHESIINRRHGIKLHSTWKGGNG
jgi:hypothetical protein